MPTWLMAGALLLSACSPPGFASHASDLLRQPPPQLPSDADAFWNDPASGEYGQFTVGARLYRYGEAICRTARVTSIDDVHQRTQDRTLLYCARPGSGYRLDETLSCRAAAEDPGVICRDTDGDSLRLPPA